MGKNNHHDRGNGPGCIKGLFSLLMVLVTVAVLGGFFLGFFGKDLAVSMQGNAETPADFKNAALVNRYSVLVKGWYPWKWVFDGISKKATAVEEVKTEKKPFNLIDGIGKSAETLEGVNNVLPSFSEEILKLATGKNVAALGVFVLFVWFIISWVRGTLLTTAQGLPGKLVTLVTTLKGSGTISALIGSWVLIRQVTLNGWDMVINSIWSSALIIGVVILVVMYVGNNWATIRNGVTTAFVTFFVLKVAVGYLDPERANMMRLDVNVNEISYWVQVLVGSIGPTTVTLLVGLGLIALGGNLMGRAAHAQRPITLRGRSD